MLILGVLQISDWRRDHSWKPDDEAAAETYLAQRYVDSPYLVIKSSCSAGLCSHLVFSAACIAAEQLNANLLGHDFQANANINLTPGLASVLPYCSFACGAAGGWQEV